MKKSLVLAMAMALGVTASAYAANPFSDVPAGHWAYDAVNKLAAEGVVDGYPDGTYGGDKLMTRYEMAQIVAKAMAKGANVDKLAAEFADELDSLGVRVANLEKKADNVKVTGQVRYHYADYGGDLSGRDNALRSRIWVNGQINEDWTYTGMFQNIQDFTDNDSEEDDLDFQRAYVEGRLGGLDVTAGRYNMFLVNGNLYNTRADGVEVSYGKDVKLTAFAAKPTDSDKDLYSWIGKYPGNYTGKIAYRDMEFEKVYGAKVDAKLGAVDATVGYTVFTDGTSSKYRETAVGADTFKRVNGKDIDDNKVWNAGVAFDVAKDLTLRADYLYATDYSDDGFADNKDMGRDGYVIGLSYAGAKASEPGSWGLYANYYDQDRPTVMAHTMNGYYGTQGFEGYMVGGNVTLAKNIVAAVEWYDLEGKDISAAYKGEDMQTLWTEVVFTF